MNAQRLPQRRQHLLAQDRHRYVQRRLGGAGKLGECQSVDQRLAGWLCLVWQPPLVVISGPDNSSRSEAILGLGTTISPTGMADSGSILFLRILGLFILQACKVETCSQFVTGYE